MEESFSSQIAGKSIDYQMFCRRVQLLWKLKGVLNILDLGHNFFSVRFGLDEDLEVLLTEGPWIIQDHYLTVRKW